MTTFEFLDDARSRRARFAPRLPDWTAIVATIQRRHAERRALVALSRLSPRRLTDMGFDPEQVYAAVAGSWDEVAPGRYRDRL